MLSTTDDAGHIADTLPYGESLAELVRRLAELPEDQVRREAESIDGTLVRQIVDLIRGAGADQLTEAAGVLNRELRREVGDVLRTVDPELAGIWHGYSRVLAEGGRRRDIASVDSVLSMALGKAGKVFDAVAATPDGAMRRDALVRIAGSDSALSKVLRALESADLIRRTTHGRNKTVHLGAAGRTLLAQRAARQELPPLGPAAGGAVITGTCTVLSVHGIDVPVPIPARAIDLWSSAA